MSSGAEGVLTVAESLERAGLPQYAPKLAELEFLSEYHIYRASADSATRLALLDYLHPFPGRVHAHVLPTQHGSAAVFCAHAGLTAMSSDLAKMHRPK